MSVSDGPSPRTAGIDHVGLSVRDLETTKAFFCKGLGWRVVGERREYPAAFVSDGISVLTLWQVESPAEAPPFDRRVNVGLHHLALGVPDREKLDALHERLAQWPGVIVEFAPQVAGKGPRLHFMVREPGGLRLEFSSTPQA
jgi:catechol 2,3-dioxygenase-like lactoylglutathione lyase family enzyme